MIPTADWRAIATARLDDARALLASGRYDWAAYTCGYAVECALKAKITETLDWPGFPSTAKEFEPFKSFKTHDLYTLLRLTGIERQVMATCETEWELVVSWNPETRYRTTGLAAAQAAQDMVDASDRLLTVL